METDLFLKRYRQMGRDGPVPVHHELVLQAGRQALADHTRLEEINQTLKSLRKQMVLQSNDPALMAVCDILFQRVRPQVPAAWGIRKIFSTRLPEEWVAATHCQELLALTL